MSNPIAVEIDHLSDVGRTSNLIAPPIKAARKWLDGMEFPAHRLLIDVSQAAPTAPPPLEMRQAMAKHVLSEVDAHLYGPILGNMDLRRSLADKWSRTYGTEFSHECIAITSGCNQAFCAVIASLCQAGDDVILTAPWYFNHDMWLTLSHVNTRALYCDETLIPDVEDAEQLIGDQTRAICLVTPNNPAGVEYSDTLLNKFLTLAQKHNVKLIIDETYLDFRTIDTVHTLWAHPAAQDHLIVLYSFSKAYRLTGHRVGAVIAAAPQISEIEKFLDTVTICPAQTGQFAAQWGLEHLDDWVERERQGTIQKLAQFRQAFDRLRPYGWTLLGSGAYFAYVAHPFAMSSVQAAKAVLREGHVLALPGAFFSPDENRLGHDHLRVAFANIDGETIETFVDRLIEVSIRLAPTEKPA
jgi:aspartate/methionine/tyrosine aminotransferase